MEIFRPGNARTFRLPAQEHARSRKAVQRAARRSGHAGEFARARRDDALSHLRFSASIEHHCEIATFSEVARVDPRSRRGKACPLWRMIATMALAASVTGCASSLPSIPNPFKKDEEKLPGERIPVIN